MRTIFAILTFFAFAPNANADPQKPVRVIEISRENAERSAQIIAASKSAFIGMPPATAVRSTDWRNAGAQLSETKTRNAAISGTLNEYSRKRTIVAEEVSRRANDRLSNRTNLKVLKRTSASASY